MGLLYQDLIRRSKSRDLDELPAILPIVLHSGQKPWSAADDVSDLVSDGPHGMGPYRPRLRYLLIDQARRDAADLAARGNLAALLFCIERCRERAVMKQLVSSLREALKDPELSGLRRAFSVWLNRVILKRLPRGQARIASNLLEDDAMLSETVLVWEKELREEGWLQGRQEGLQEGRHEELRSLLSRLMEKRFGELPAGIGLRLRGASLEELESWTDGLLEASNLNDAIGCMQPKRADS